MKNINKRAFISLTVMSVSFLLCLPAVFAASLSLTVPNGPKGSQVTGTIGFQDALNVTAFSLTLNFSSGTVLTADLATQPTLFTRGAFFPSAVLGTQEINFLEPETTRKIHFVGLTLPTASTAVQSIGTLKYNVASGATDGDTQVVTLSGQVYTAAGEVVDLVPVSVTFTVGVSSNDTDNDNMPDSWEITHFGDLSRDGTKDFDGDGLKDLDEYLNGTNPKLKDTDEDNMEDGWEVQYGLQPTVKDGTGDKDGDGYSNYQEWLYGTDPSNKDSFPIWKVDAGVAASGDGLTWDAAFKTIQEALDHLGTSGIVWVKGGTYNLGAPLQVNKSASILGGFAGTETSAADRNWSARPTILHGNGASQCLNISANSTVDGFVIKGGNGSLGGGAISTSAAVKFTNCRFEGNNATSGGAVYNLDSTVTISNSVFFGNSAATGAGLYNQNSAVSLSNCTFHKNVASSGGGAVTNDAASTLTVVSSILWGDTPKEIDNLGGAVGATYSDVDVVGGQAGIGNIYQDPLFKSPAKGDLGLGRGSKCIDAGSNSGIDAQARDLNCRPRIVDGNADRTATVDMGAFEYGPRAIMAPANFLLH